MRTVLKCFF